MKAVIMAGGEGSRLRPLTCDLPKPMVPVMNKPIMEHTIELLKSHGITDIAITLMYLPQKIKDYFGDGSNFGVNLHYFTEDTPLGTAGSVKNADEFLDDTFVVISGDGLTDMNLTKAIEFHRARKSLATLILCKVDVPLEYGVVVMDEDGLITRFLEKPSWSEVFSDTANTGTYILEPEALKYFKKGQKFDFSQDLFPILLKENKPMYGYVISEYWCDVGDLRAYIQSHYDVLEGKVKINMPYSEVKPSIWIGSGTEIHPEADIKGPCIIGNNCKIGKASIENFTIIGNNNVIEENVSLKKSIVWDNTSVQFGSELRGSILCNKVNVKNFVSIFENAVVGDDTIINERAIIKPNVKIWPQKVVDTLAIVDRNIIWGAKFSRTIFGENGLSGIVNIDLSPEFATRLGAAYGSTFKKGSRVGISSTNSNSARMFKYAFISGLLSVGVEVFNISGILTPISRHAINFLAVNGGLHIKTDNDNPNKIFVDFLDKKGASITRNMERKIENSFAREDFKRASGVDIHNITNINDYRTYYINAMLNEINDTLIKSSSPKIVMYSPSELVFDTASIMLKEVGCQVLGIESSGKSKEDAIEMIKKTLSSDKYHLGAYIDSNAETLVLVDANGNVIEDDLLNILCSTIIFKTNKNARIVAPVTASKVLEKIALVYGGEVSRTKSSSQAIMEEMLSSNIFKSKENLLQFVLNFDAIGGLLKIIEHLAVNKITLDKLVGEIPKFYMVKKKIFCPWELKGTVMRTIIQEKEKTKSKVEMLDGVKFVFENGWALVLPDADKPLVRVFAEGDNAKIAEDLAEKYAKRIKEIVNI